MLRADRLTVVHHDDSTSEFTNVSYALDRGVRVITACGDEKAFAEHDVFVIHARLAHQRTGDRAAATPGNRDGCSGHGEQAARDCGGCAA